MTAGYSGTPLVKKLGIKVGSVVIAINAPAHYRELIAPLPTGAMIIDDERGNVDLVHLFVNSRAGLREDLARSRDLIKQDGAIWVSWYKKAARLPTELTEDAIRECAFPLGLVDVKVCAVDEQWSGLKLVIRKENRV